MPGGRCLRARSRHDLGQHRRYGRRHLPHRRHPRSPHRHHGPLRRHLWHPPWHPPWHPRAPPVAPPTTPVSPPTTPLAPPLAPPRPAPPPSGPRNDPRNKGRGRSQPDPKRQPRVTPEPADPPPSRDEPALYVVRLQAQGGGLEKSVILSGMTPITVAQGIAGLAELRGKLTRKQADERAEPFRRAERFIRNAPAGGGIGPPGKSFALPRSDIRVDVEIKRGINFRQ